MKVFVTDRFLFPLTEGHRFPMEKYALTRQLVDASGLFPADDLIVPHSATDAELELAHCPEYVARQREGRLSVAEVRRIGFPWSPEVVERARRTCGGTIEACRAASAEGVAVNLAGGTHHAFRDAGEGYCLFNDSVVAARVLLAEGLVQRVVVIDCDVHQGNGTAALCRDDERIFTFSIHGANNFPLRKEQSDLDVGLADGTSDEAYLEAVEAGVWEALHRAHADFAIYLSGADPYEGDRLGRLKVSKPGLLRRDRLVLEAIRRCRLPVAVTMGGGYAHDPMDTAEIYFQTVRAALECAGA